MIITKESLAEKTLAEVMTLVKTHEQLVKDLGIQINEAMNNYRVLITKAAELKRAETEQSIPGQ